MQLIHSEYNGHLAALLLIAVSCSQVWPMDRAFFLLDEKRLDVTNNTSYIFEAFADEYGDDAATRW